MNKQIMIVDDSPSIRMQVRMILKSIGIDLIEAGGQKSMIQNIEQNGSLVDLIIMDLTLVKDNGFDLIESLRTNEHYKKIPIIILTESADKGNIMHAAKFGVFEYMLKPITKDTLIARIKKLLSI